MDAVDGWLLWLLVTTTVFASKDCNRLPEDYKDCQVPQSQNISSTQLVCFDDDEFMVDSFLFHQLFQISTACLFPDYSCVAVFVGDSYLGGCVPNSGHTPRIFQKSDKEEVSVEETNEFRLMRSCGKFEKTCENTTVQLETKSIVTKVCCCSGEHCSKVDPEEWDGYQDPWNTSWDVVSIAAALLATCFSVIICSLIQQRYTVHKYKKMIKKAKEQLKKMKKSV